MEFEELELETDFVSAGRWRDAVLCSQGAAQDDRPDDGGMTISSLAWEGQIFQRG